MELLVPYLTLMKEDAPQRAHSLRELFNGLRWLIRTGSPWRMMPHDLPPWHAVYQQTRRWARRRLFRNAGGRFACLLRLTTERNLAPSAVILDSRTIQSTPESGGRAGLTAPRTQRQQGALAVDTLGHLLALKVTPANQQDREQVEHWPSGAAGHGQPVELAYVDQGYTGARAAEGAQEQASGWKWSSCRSTRAARSNLCCCPDAGWSSARSHGQHGCGVWRGITNACPPPWRATTGSRSRCSCSKTSSPKVHDRL